MEGYGSQTSHRNPLDIIVVYLFVANFTTLLVSHITWLRKVEWLVKEMEKMWKKEVVALGAIPAFSWKD
jgi:hypothetical protein